MFKWTTWDPLEEEASDKGKITREAVLPAFRDFPWGDMLAKMRDAKEEDVHCLPSVGFTNLDDGHSLEIALAEDAAEPVFYLFYDESADALSRYQLLDQSPEAATEILAAFATGDYDRVRERFERADRPESSGLRPWWRFW
jgi:hypothetical protein